MISTDHAPHAEKEKNLPMEKAAFGIVGLETSACLTYTELVEKGVLTIMQMVEKMSYNPARILGLEDKGSVSEGKTADIVIFDPSAEYRIDKNTFLSKGKNTPFDGYPVKGEVCCTIVDGRIVYTLSLIHIFGRLHFFINSGSLPDHILENIVNQGVLIAVVGIKGDPACVRPAAQLCDGQLSLIHI